MASARRGKPLSQAHREKLSASSFAKTQLIKQREHAKLAGTYNKSEEHKKKLSAAAAANGAGKQNKGKIRTKVACPTCGKLGARNVMTRWHFENCNAL